jgi:hypothetical protein
MRRDWLGASPWLWRHAHGCDGTPMVVAARPWLWRHAHGCGGTPLVVAAHPASTASALLCGSVWLASKRGGGIPQAIPCWSSQGGAGPHLASYCTQARYSHSAHPVRPSLLQDLCFSTCVFEDTRKFMESIDCYLFWRAPLSIMASLAATAARAPWPGKLAVANGA